MQDLQTQPRKPAVWKWYVAYCVLMAVLYLLVVVMGFYFLLADPAELDMEPLEANIVGLCCIGLGLALTVPYAAAPFLPRKGWAWVYGVVMICIGMTSACCLPAAIPLLIFWLKPETKLYFGRAD